MCSSFNGNTAEQLYEKLFSHIEDDDWFSDRQHIKCITEDKNAGGICAFLQGTNGLSGKDIKTLGKRIADHNCHCCGSVPVYYDKNENDVALHGMLTFNYVLKPSV